VSASHGAGSSGELSFMRALLSWKRGEHHRVSAALLESALQEQMDALKERPFGIPFLLDLNPSRMLDMAKLFIQHVGGEPRSPTEPPNEYLGKCQRCDMYTPYSFVTQPATETN
jgi:tetratricopeptide repeat protein 21B